MDPATRLLQLLTLLNARPTWTSGELARRLEVTARTVRRDITRLRDLDYPVEAVSGPHGGYRLGRGAEVPPLVLDDQEALAVALGLRMTTTHAADGVEGAAVSALAKLERVLPTRLSEQLRDVQEATVAIAPGHVIAADADQLLVLAQACRRRERVRFMYTAANGDRSLRHVDPFRLVHAARRWYLAAYDLDRDDWRTFRVDRLSATLPTGASCDPREEPDAAELVRSGIAVAAYPIKALVRLHLPYDEVAKMVPRNVALLEADGDDATLMRVGGSDPRWIVSYLAGFPCRIEVLEPSEVHDALHEHVRVLLGDDRDHATATG